MPLGLAFAKSSNVVAAKLAQQIGIDKVIAMAKKMGITTKLPNSPSLALGSAEVSLMELTSAYAILQAKGRAIEPSFILTIPHL